MGEPQQVDDATRQAIIDQYRRDAAARAAAGVPDEQPDPGPDIAAAVNAGTDQVAAASVSAPVPAEPLPAESEHDKVMAMHAALAGQVSELSGTMMSEIASLKRQLAAAQAAAQVATAPDLLAAYATGVRDKLASHARLNPDIPAAHFDAAVKAAGTLAEHAAEGEFDQPAADVVERFLTKSHWRLHGKPLDFSAALYDLEMARDEAAKLAA